MCLAPQLVSTILPFLSAESTTQDWADQVTASR
jgi:hypothetical protein